MFTSASVGHARAAASCGAVIGRRRQQQLRGGGDEVMSSSSSSPHFLNRRSGNNNPNNHNNNSGRRRRIAAAGHGCGVARRRRVTCAAESGDGDNSGQSGGGGGAPQSAADALAERMAKAKAYKELREKEAGELDGNSELQSVLSEAMARLDAGKGQPTPTPEPEQRSVRVKIMTKDNNYNPFAEDEQVVGFEKGDEVFKPEMGGWGGEASTDMAAMLQKGRRRERGLGSEEDNARAEEDDAKAKASEAEADYKPKVSTWGVFPRPDNISKTYGGGKTIKAGEFTAETAEEKEARRERIRAKMNKYREDQGIAISNGTLVRWQTRLTECQTLMRKGKLAGGVEALEAIVLEEKINPRSEIGGQITFHYAMCLDNVQRREEALEMYKRCIGNPYGKISRQADNMIWGMTTAATKMKAGGCGCRKGAG